VNMNMNLHLHLPQPSMVRQLYSHVFVLLDDVELVPSSSSSSSSSASDNGVVSGSSGGGGGRQQQWDLALLVGTMRYHNLHLASARVTGACVCL
jgi:hypothetical protein